MRHSLSHCHCRLSTEGISVLAWFEEPAGMHILCTTADRIESRPTTARQQLVAKHMYHQRRPFDFVTACRVAEMTPPCRASQTLVSVSTTLFHRCERDTNLLVDWVSISQSSTDQHRVLLCIDVPRSFRALWRCARMCRRTQEERHLFLCANQ